MTGTFIRFVPPGEQPLPTNREDRADAPVAPQLDDDRLEEAVREHLDAGGHVTRLPPARARGALRWGQRPDRRPNRRRGACCRTLPLEMTRPRKGRKAS
jgi:hypothetical protein